MNFHIFQYIRSTVSIFRVQKAIFANLQMKDKNELQEKKENRIANLTLIFTSFLADPLEALSNSKLVVKVLSADEDA